MIQRYYFIIFICFLTGCKNNQAKEPEDLRPNIIFLLTDDQRWDALGAAGNKIIQTPHLDLLAMSSQYYKNAYVTTSICMVSRASILSGQYESRHGIHDFFTSFTEEAFEETYPAILRKNGYKTGFIGKFGVGNPKDQPQDAFDYWAGTPMHQPNYESKDKNGNDIHYSDLLSQNIHEFINQTDKAPFCLSVSFKAPHSQDGDPRQFIPNKRYADLYNEVTIPTPETAASKYWDSLPSFFHNEKNIARNRWKMRFETPEKFQESVKNYYRLITGVDDAVGQLMQEAQSKEFG